MNHQDFKKLLTVNDIGKKFNGISVLESINFTINEGEIVGILGDNGAGKSTLIKVLCGVIEPDSGFLEWQGAKVVFQSKNDSTRLGIETIFQDNALVDSMSVARNIFLNREITNRYGFLSHKKMVKLSSEVLSKMTGIKGIESTEKLVGELSGGQKQAVAIARALYFKNRIILLDEPTSALSVRATDALFENLKDLRNKNFSSVIVTHDIYNAFNVCDRFIVLSKGRIVLMKQRNLVTLEELIKHVSRA